MSTHSSRHRFIALVEDLRRVLGFPEEPMPDTESDDALLRRGDRLLLTSFGAGYVAAGAYLRWSLSPDSRPA